MRSVVCYICACTRIPRALGPLGHSNVCPDGILVSVFLALAFLLSVGTPWRLSQAPLPCSSLSFHCFISVMGACFFSFCVGLLAGMPGFASHGSGLHLGAGCQWWKLLDVSGTQPPLCKAVVNMWVVFVVDTMCTLIGCF